MALESLKKAVAQQQQQGARQSSPQPQKTQPTRSLPAVIPNTFPLWVDGILGALGSVALCAIGGYVAPVVWPALSIAQALSAGFAVSHALRLAYEWPQVRRLTLLSGALSVGWVLDAWSLVSLQAFGVGLLLLTAASWALADLTDGDGRVQWSTRVSLGMFVAIALHTLLASVQIGN